MNESADIKQQGENVKKRLSALSHNQESGIKTDFAIKDKINWAISVDI
jgi:hypothetical protein